MEVAPPSEAIEESDCLAAHGGQQQPPRRFVMPGGYPLMQSRIPAAGVTRHADNQPHNLDVPFPPREAQRGGARLSLGNDVG